MTPRTIGARSGAMLRRIQEIVRRAGRIGLEGKLAFVLALVAFYLGGAREHFFFGAPGPVGYDDGYILSVGERLIDEKWLPYVDSYALRGPMLYWGAGLAELATGRFGWVGGRVYSTVVTFGTLLALYGVGVAARKPFAGAFAMLVYAWSVFGVMDEGPAFGLTGERVAGPFAVLALAFLALGLRREGHLRARLALIAAAGASAALAGMSKQTCLPTIAPLFVWVSAAAWSDGRLERAERWRLPLALLGGFLAVIVVVLSRYAVIGKLGQFWYWFYRYSADAYMRPYTLSGAKLGVATFVRDHPWTFGAVALLAAPSLARPLLGTGRGLRGLARGYDAAGLEVTAAVLGLSLLAAGCAPLRFWGHYFMCAFPFFALVAGLRARELLHSRSESRRTLSQAAAGAIFAVFAGYVVLDRVDQLATQRRAGGWIPPAPEALCPVIDRYAPPGERIFIWGFDADLYLTCRRRPATRFTYLTLVAGTIPPFWSDVREEYVAKHAREDLLEDLRKERPPLILDMPANLGGISMQQVPKLDRYLKQAYCEQPAAAGRSGRPAAVFVRKDLPACKKVAR